MTNELIEQYAPEEKLHESGGADLSKPFYYIAGPMSGYPDYNFPAFHEASYWLRESGFNVVSPAELDVEEHRNMVAKIDPALAGPGSKEWTDCLRRDINIVANKNCLGCICIAGWEKSKGARLETYIAESLGLKLVSHEVLSDGIKLTEINRSEKLMQAYEAFHEASEW